MNETETRTGTTGIEVRLNDGERLSGTLAGEREHARAELGILHERLIDQTFISIGDLVVRSEHVRWIRIRDEEQPGLLKNLLTGGDSAMETRQDRMSAGRYGAQGMGARGWSGRPQWDETKPFALTSEFVAYVLTVLAIAITTAVFDNLDVWHGMLLITAVTGGYLLSRGFAKSGSPHREDSSRGYGMLGSGGGGADGDDV